MPEFFKHARCRLGCFFPEGVSQAAVNLDRSPATSESGSVPSLSPPPPGSAGAPSHQVFSGEVWGPGDGWFPGVLQPQGEPVLCFLRQVTFPLWPWTQLAHPGVSAHSSHPL